MAEIVGIHGASVEAAMGKTDPMVMEILRGMVEKGEAGGLRGVAVAYVTADGGVGSWWNVVSGSGHLLLSGCVYLQHELCTRSENLTDEATK